MLAHGFTSDLPSKSLFSKRPRCNSHRLRYRTWQKTVSMAHPSSSTSLLPKAPPFSTKFIDNSTNPPFVFTFKLPEWASTWKVLRSKVSRGYFKKPNARRPNPEFQVLFDSLASDLKNMRISGGSRSSRNPNSDTTSKPTSKYFRLLDLPREIRDLIYSFAVTNPPADAAPAPAAAKQSPPKLTPIHIFYERSAAAEHGRVFLSRVDPSIFALLSTNRTVLAEALPIFYRLNRFYLRGVTGPAAILRLDAAAFRNIQHLDIILARRTTLIIDLVPVLRALVRLPRLRDATIQRAAVEPRKDIALRLDLAADAGMCAVCDTGKGMVRFESGLMVLSRNPWLRINLAFYSDKDKDRDAGEGDAVPVSSCAICALAAMVAQRCGPDREEGEMPTSKSIDIAVSRDGLRGDGLETPEASTQYPVLLPSLKDTQSIGLFRRRSLAAA